MILLKGWIINYHVSFRPAIGLCSSLAFSTDLAIQCNKCKRVT